jgi:enoyl-CoA hydratase/carnithine racemase
MTLSGLAIHDHGPIREIRMDRPPVNALDAGLVQELLDALQGCTDPAVGAFVLSGQPGIFSAGLDLPSLLALDRSGMAVFWRQLVALLRTIARSPVPVLAAMTGHSPAGGTVLCLYADYRVMARGDYKVGLNEVQVGLPVPDFIQRGLVRLVGTRQAGSLVMAGRLIGPEEARAIGLVDELAAPEQVLECALGRARQWLELSPLAFQTTREISRRDLGFMDQDSPEVETLVTFWFRPETQEALHRYVDSFRKRRDPDRDRPRRSKT